MGILVATRRLNMRKITVKKIFHIIYKLFQASRGAGACGCKYDRFWFRFLVEEFKYLIFSFFRSGVCARWVPPLNTQRLQNSAESRSVLTLSSLCLSCYMRDTTWYWKKYLRMYLLLNIYLLNYNPYLTDNKNTNWGQSWRRDTKCDCKTDCLWVRSSLEEMKYLLIFPFLRSGVEAKRGVEFRHSTRNASRTQRKVGNGVSYH